MDINNENSFTSHLRQPSRIASPGKLSEISASANNARSSAMPPPASTVNRKTLVERAGETARPMSGASGSRQVSASVKTTSLAGTARQASFSSSTSSMRPPSLSSMRNASNGSFSTSVSSGSRPPSSQYFRPQTAMGSSRIQKPVTNSVRPSTAMETHNTGPQSRKRKGMTPFSLDVDGTPMPAQMQRNGSQDPNMNYASGWGSKPVYPRSMRDFSISTAMGRLSLDDAVPLPASDAKSGVPFTPSQIPRLAQSVAEQPETPSPSKSPRKRAPAMSFLTRDSNTPVALDIVDIEQTITQSLSLFQESITGATAESQSLKDIITMYKGSIKELDAMREQLQASNATLQADLDAAKAQLTTSVTALEDSKRYHHITIDDHQRQHRRELEDWEREKEQEIRHMDRTHQNELTDVKRQLEDALEDERARRQKDLQLLTSEGAMSQQKAEVELEKQKRVVQAMHEELDQAHADVTRERSLNGDLRAQLLEAASNAMRLETNMSSLRAHITFLESDNKSQSQAFADLEMRMQNAIRSAGEANEKLRTEETLRRKLHNQVQELKGNIRVFCRVRPPLESDSESARITYPDKDSDSKEVEVLGQPEKSSLGKVTTKTNLFAFDRVFSPNSLNADVFGEISQLVQSALDGYNVCIFCYGQTGSGKTFTMSSVDGMIPLAVQQIYDTAKSLEEKGWKYSMEGSFVEVYNENLNDLLGTPDELDKKKYEIRHDMQKCKTTITDVTVVDLDTPEKVETILRRATANRSVAATNANERSSRSHSVFILKLKGENNVTGEKSEGTLNLVDLAGSERLSHSGATGERLKETQSINKSLSCLGDVIGALGQGKEGGHVPYRNSKLTHLLQFSLGGNSKTLMFVMISPLQAHLSETLTSLKFATKVHNTHIGTAKKQTKV